MPAESNPNINTLASSLPNNFSIAFAKKPPMILKFFYWEVNLQVFVVEWPCVHQHYPKHSCLIYFHYIWRSRFKKWYFVTRSVLLRFCACHIKIDGNFKDDGFMYYALLQSNFILHNSLRNLDYTNQPSSIIYCVILPYSLMNK